MNGHPYDEQGWRLFDQQYFGSIVKSFEILVATAYPILLPMYLFKWLLSTSEGSDLIASYSSAFGPHLILIISTSLVFLYTYVLICYICSHDQILAPVLSLHVLTDISKVPFDRKYLSEYKRAMSEGGNFRWMVYMVAGLFVPYAILGFLRYLYCL